MAVHSLEWTKKHYKGSPKLQFIPTQTLIKGSKQTCNQKLVSAICCVARTCFCTKMVFVPFLLTMMRVADAASPRKDLLEMKRFGLGIDQALVHDYTLHRSQTPPSSWLFTPRSWSWAWRTSTMKFTKKMVASPLVSQVAVWSRVHVHSLLVLRLEAGQAPCIMFQKASMLVAQSISKAVGAVSMQKRQIPWLTLCEQIPCHQGFSRSHAQVCGAHIWKLSLKCVLKVPDMLCNTYSEDTCIPTGPT